MKKTELKQFKSGLKTFLITLLVKFFEESPLGSALVCSSVVYDPVIAKTSQKGLKSRFELT